MKRKIHNVQFYGGCSGNTQGVSRLVENMEAAAVIQRLEGIRCGFRNKIIFTFAKKINLWTKSPLFPILQKLTTATISGKVFSVPSLASPFQ
jgi:hypothetical protein